MIKKEIVKVDDFKQVFDLFADGAKLVSVQYTACNDESTINDVRSARLSFLGKRKFALEFIGVDCVHVVPITMGNIMLSDIALGQFGKMIFWADDSMFNVSEPDSSLSYVVAKGLVLYL